MEFCSVEQIDDRTLSGLLGVYEETIASLYGSQYAGRYKSEKNAIKAMKKDYTDFLVDFIETEDRYIFALQDGDTYAAALRLIHMSGGSWYLEALETAPAYRGKGCARKLLSDTIKCVRTLSARSIVSLIRKENAASRAAHEACGFADTGRTAKDINGSTLDDCLVYEYRYEKK